MYLNPRQQVLLAGRLEDVGTLRGRARLKLEAKLAIKLVRLGHGRRELREVQLALRGVLHAYTRAGESPRAGAVSVPRTLLGRAPQGSAVSVPRARLGRARGRRRPVGVASSAPRADTHLFLAHLEEATVNGAVAFLKRVDHFGLGALVEDAFALCGLLRRRLVPSQREV